MRNKKKNYFFPSDTSVLKVLTAFSLPKTVSISMIRLVKEWIDSSGPEFAVSRLKDLKLHYLNGIAGGSQVGTWMSCHADGRPKGPFGYLWRVQHRTHWKVRTRILNTLMMYTGLKLKNTSENQWKKFSTSFCRPNNWSYPIFDGDIKDIENETIMAFRRNWEKSEYSDPRDWCSSPTKRTKVFVPFEGIKSGIESSFSIDDHLAVGHCSNEGMPVRRFKDIYCHTGFRPAQFDIELKTEFRPMVGSISVIQERGCKARIIVNPYRIHQIALSRLGNCLFSFLRQLRWDCTHDQQQGIDFCQRKLAEGYTAHCVDLSDATNNFPVEYQIEVLRLLTPDEEFQRSLDLFLWISRNGLWDTPPKEKRKFRQAAMCCTQGQPLGLYPSFASFALVHGLIIRGLERRYGRRNTFVVLGDDVAIFDSQVYNGYLSVLKDLKVPVSETKSIVSKEIAEFAGKIITKFGPLGVEKWKGFKLSDPLTLLRFLGKRGIPLIPIRLRPLVLKYASLPEPLGIGLNLDGSSASKRLEAVEDDYLLKQPLLQDDMASEHSLRNTELHVAFGHERHLRDLYNFELPPTRQSRRFSVEEHRLVDHINANLKELDFEPEMFKQSIIELRRKKKASREELSQFVKSTTSRIPSIVKMMFTWAMKTLKKR